MEVKIPKEVRQHKETIFFGLSVRQFVCSLLAVAVAAAAYLLLGKVMDKSSAGWICILLAAPFAVSGFSSYDGMSFEEFVWEFIKSEILCAGPRVFVSENIYYDVLFRKEGALDKISGSSKQKRKV